MKEFFCPSCCHMRPASARVIHPNRPLCRSCAAKAAERCRNSKTSERAKVARWAKVQKAYKAGAYAFMSDALLHSCHDQYLDYYGMDRDVRDFLLSH